MQCPTRELKDLQLTVYIKWDRYKKLIVLRNSLIRYVCNVLKYPNKHSYKTGNFKNKLAAVKGDKSNWPYFANTNRRPRSKSKTVEPKQVSTRLSWCHLASSRRLTLINFWWLYILRRSELVQLWGTVSSLAQSCVSEKIVTFISAKNCPPITA